MIETKVIWNDGANACGIFRCSFPALPRIGEMINVCDIKMSAIGLYEDDQLSEFDELTVHCIRYEPGKNTVDVFCKTRWISRR